MPKITRQGGPSYEVDEFTDAHGITWRNANDFTEEEPSPGNSSSPSDGKPQTSATPSGTTLPKRARTTVSRSKKAPPADSTAGSTATAGPADN